jgi:hypothetical protein
VVPLVISQELVIGYAEERWVVVVELSLQLLLVIDGERGVVPRTFTLLMHHLPQLVAVEAAVAVKPAHPLHRLIRKMDAQPRLRHPTGTCRANLEQRPVPTRRRPEHRLPQ